MDQFDAYFTQIPDWATSLELIASEPEERFGEFPFLVPEGSKFVVATTSSAEGREPASGLVRLETKTPDEDLSEKTLENEQEFIHENRGLIVLNDPKAGRWNFAVRSELNEPYAISLMAFHPSGQKLANASSGSSTPTPWKCRACKSTAKALALAIVATATFPAIPQALITAVSTFLGGMSAAAVGAFISSLLGDTADVIAEKLCQKVNLC